MVATSAIQERPRYSPDGDGDDIDEVQVGSHLILTDESAQY